MMDITELRRLSAKHELSLNYIYKDLMISQALLSFKDDRLILKGGTAINRLFLKDRARFSEDIDFDLKTSGSLKETIAVTQRLVSSMKGYSVEKPRVMGSIVRHDAFFINPLGVKDRIMIEFSPVRHAAQSETVVVNFGFVPAEAALLNVYTLQKLFRQKIDCLLSRMEGKDIYDLYYLSEICPTLPTKREYEKIEKRLTLTDREIKNIANATNHYIPRSLRPNWPSFIAELKRRLKPA